MWTDNTRKATIIKGDPIKVFNISNGYENIYYNKCTQYVDLFHTLMILWENENFLNNPVYFVSSQCEGVPSSFLLS